MLHRRHVVLWSVLTLGAASCAVRRPDAEPAAPAGAPESPAAPESQAPAQPGYGMAPPAPADEAKPGTPSSATPALGDRAADDGYTSLAEAEAALEKARAELGAPRAEARPAESQPEKAKRPSTAPAGGAAPLAEGAERCVNACKAFASLKRAASAVCRLAGDTNARCKRAQTIVQDSEARVAVCKCDKNGD